METNLDKIKKIAKEKEDENREFRAFLKNCDIPSKQIDLIVQHLYQKVRSEIDCKTCMNCCKELQPVLDEEDIKNLAECLGSSIMQLKKQYLFNSKGEAGYLFKKKPCPFLKDNLCLCYNNRPKDCITFPHLSKEGFVFRLLEIIENCCPIVFNVYELLKKQILEEGYNNWQHPCHYG